ncbi:hypothetical protein BCD67_15450 [Oscillatoriales cyanobacterium USR001]|nr:hypothetical protein BCD67_15450 [Oscillatoriales cyanobacterium USR001]
MAITDFPAPIPGYSLIEQLYAGSRTLVYRGIREANNQAVAIKLLRREHPSFSEIINIRNQYNLANNLRIDGIVRAIALERYGNSYALIMEDFGGLSLRDYSKNHVLELKEVLEIAIKLTNILHYLYQQRVIHKDIKPSNILIHPITKEIKITDFSIASLLPRETQTITNPEVLEGTLAYLSPEQTGRMNRGIDYRSDFYNLGVTFFELLTGELPFQSNDPMELIHCHIAKKPPLVSEIKPEIPVALSLIVEKLMAKNAEDRYQNALGLKHDLEVCQQQWQQRGGIPEFMIAQRDLSDRFLIPEKLYGRENEVNQCENFSFHGAKSTSAIG